MLENTVAILNVEDDSAPSQAGGTSDGGVGPDEWAQSWPCSRGKGTGPHLCVFASLSDHAAILRKSWRRRARRVLPTRLSSQ